MGFSASSQSELPGPDDQVSLAIEPATLTLLERARDTYGNLVEFRDLRGRRAVFVNRPSLLRQILVRQHSRYAKGPGFERVKMLLGNGIIVSDGDLWRRHRRIMQPAFTRRAVERSIAMMCGASERRIAEWQRIADAGAVLDLTTAMSDFALEVILRSIFGPDYERCIAGEQGNPFAFLSEDATRDLRVVTRLRSVREMVRRLIDERRRRDADESDFLGALIGGRDRDGRGLDDDEIVDEVMTLVVAGYETSAGTLNWAWYLLARHRHVERKLVDEARRVAGERTALDAEAIAALRYTRQVLDETLRLYPPVWLYTRKAVEEDELDGARIDPDTSILIAPYVLQRSPEFWPDPERFDPDRFADVETSADNVRAYCPFSLGPRRCIGEYFAFLEMQSHLAILAQRFRMELVTTVEPALDLGVNLRVAQPIHVRLERR